jgi:3-hydroxyisobutyrate dehydrogenase-like beta-hydroxyacid dehydrogenase
MKVGFIGLGVMGGPMAANVLKGGHELTVYDLNPAAVAQLTALGARAAASPRELGQASEVVITMLPEPQHVEGAILGENGAAAGMAAGGTVIDMSTIDPTTSQRVGQALKARGIAMVDSPVGKTSEHAVTGTLTLMIGGEAADIERVRPVLSCMGNQFFICGGQGMGHAMKMTNNLLATTIMCANTEALAIGAKCGLTLETMVEVMKTTMGWNQQLAVALPKKAFLGDDSPGFMVKLAAKDVRLAVAAARQQGFEPMVGAGALATLDRAAQLGRADRDTAALLFLREEELGIRVRPAASPAAAA